MSARSVTELVRTTETGKKVKYLWFWGHRPESDGSVGPGCLSQWWRSPFRLDGFAFATAEHYMMWRKARLFDDTGNLARFEQHDDLRTYLLNTGRRVLVEASPVDRIWGIGLAGDDPRAKDPARWRGSNLLGFALMEVRDRLAGSAGRSTS